MNFIQIHEEMTIAVYQRDLFMPHIFNNQQFVCRETCIQEENKFLFHCSLFSSFNKLYFPDSIIPRNNFFLP